MEKVYVDIHATIEDEFNLEEFNELKQSVESLANTIEVSEDAMLSIEERINFEQNILASDATITSEMVSMSVASNESLFNILGYKYDSSKIASLEDHKEALALSLEAKILGFKDIMSMLKNVYDKFVNLLKKLYVKALVFMNNVKDKADKMTTYLNNNRAKASSVIAIDKKLEASLLKKYGAYLYGFSNGKIDTKFVESLLADLTSSKIMGDHRLEVFRIVKTLVDFSNRAGVKFSEQVESQDREAIEAAFNIKEEVLSAPFKYSGDKYKCLKVPPYKIPTNITYQELFKHIGAIKIVTDVKKIDTKTMQGKFSEVKYDDLIEMVKLVAKDTSEIKSFNKEIEDEAKKILKTINDIDLGNTKEESAVFRFIFPATRYANTILSTISIDKMIGYINGLKDVMSMVGAIAKEGVATSEGAEPIKDQFLLPGIK